jgi:hypothetical protein
MNDLHDSYLQETYRGIEIFRIVTGRRGNRVAYVAFINGSRARRGSVHSMKLRIDKELGSPKPNPPNAPLKTDPQVGGR